MRELEPQGRRSLASGRSRDCPGYRGQVVGRRTLEEAESSREDEAACESSRRMAVGQIRWARQKCRGSAGAGNPIPPQSGRRQHSEEHRTFTRGSAGQGDLDGAATGGPGTSEGECAQGGPLGRRARSAAAVFGGAVSFRGLRALSPGPRASIFGLSRWAEEGDGLLDDALVPEDPAV